MTRAGKRKAQPARAAKTLNEDTEPPLEGWEEFAKTGLLR
jgi:hypothetical protein